MKSLNTVLILGGLFSMAASAAGFALPEQSARSLGQAGTGTASAVGASTVYYNAGNMAFEDGVAVDVSGILIVPNFAYAPDPQSAKTHILAEAFVQPAVFATAKVSDRISVGVGGFSDFGLGLQWPSGFAGRYDSTASNITTFTINPSVAFKLNDNIGVGVGIDITRATVELSQAINFGQTDGISHLGGGAWGVGVNAGVGTKWLNDDLHVGLNWRSLTPLHFKGRVDFSTAREFETALPDQAVTTSITLPNLISLGASYRFVKQFSVAVDLNYTTWSSFQSINLTFDSAPPQTLVRNWKNTLTARLGGEYTLADCFSLRAGIGYDPSPSPAETLSASLPDGNRLLLTAGVGYKAGSVGIDAGYMYVSVAQRSSTAPAFPATYSGHANVVGLSLTYRQ